MTVSGCGEVREGQDRTKRKNTHGHRQQCGDCSGGRSIRKLNGGGKLQ